MEPHALRLWCVMKSSSHCSLSNPGRRSNQPTECTQQTAAGREKYTPRATGVPNGQSCDSAVRGCPEKHPECDRASSVQNPAGSAHQPSPVGQLGRNYTDPIVYTLGGGIALMVLIYIVVTLCQRWAV
jgi:hypothetical protein